MKLIHEENSLLKHRLGMCAKQDEQLCVICMERPSDYAVIPCGHKCVCREDTDLIRQTNECPVCRTTVQGCFLIWHAGVWTKAVATRVTVSLLLISRFSTMQFRRTSCIGYYLNARRAGAYCGQSWSAQSSIVVKVGHSAVKYCGQSWSGSLFGPWYVYSGVQSSWRQKQYSIRKTDQNEQMLHIMCLSNSGSNLSTSLGGDSSGDQRTKGSENRHVLGCR